MKVVSVTGINGGVGATTVVAGLASMLSARKWQVIVLDLSPHNTLRLHFGMPWDEGNGLVPQILSGKPWHEAAYLCENGVSFLPFGKCGEQDIATFNRQLRQEPDWLSSHLSELEDSDETIILIDCPRTEGPLRSQAHALSDQILVVMEAGPLSYAALAAPGTIFAATDAPKATYLLNSFNPTLTLDRDIAQLLRVEQGERLCPATIHRDEFVREALASKLSLDAYAPYSQAADDFTTLSIWLVAKFAHLELASA
ncbi:MAG TPA: cellulose biosynthesis protein BcsQ [Gallionella sp.]|nr:cellulose biosynthesis protein BcsQ [Gallionella sp.]